MLLLQREAEGNVGDLVGVSGGYTSVGGYRMGDSWCGILDSVWVLISASFLLLYFGSVVGGGTATLIFTCYIMFRLSLTIFC